MSSDPAEEAAEPRGSKYFLTYLDDYVDNIKRVVAAKGALTHPEEAIILVGAAIVERLEMLYGGVHSVDRTLQEIRDTIKDSGD